MVLPLIAVSDWTISTLAKIFISLIDWVVYALVYCSYEIFNAVTQLNLFAKGSGGEEIFTSLTSRIYSVITIVMIFVFAYRLLTAIVNPDSDGKVTGGIIKDLFISLILIIVMPTIFEYMTIFQQHVLLDNTITNIILDDNGGATEDAATNMTMMTFVSFYHPRGTNYNTFFDNGLRSDAKERCTSAGANEEVCNKYVEDLKKISGTNDCNEKEGNLITPLTTDTKLHKYLNDDDGMEYMWIICSICGVIVAYFFLSYAIDLGVRAVKLGVLQIIAPIPLILRVFPKSKAKFDEWLKELIKTYVDLFIRIAFISFIILIATMIPTFVTTIVSANDRICGSPILVALATIILFLGLLSFAKEAPDMFKRIFGGGDWLSGLNLKPGVKGRIENNEYAMRAAGMAVGGIGGAIATGYNAGKNSLSGNGKTPLGKAIKVTATGIGGGIRGLVAGGTYGAKNVTKLDQIGGSFKSGAYAGQQTKTIGEKVAKIPKNVDETWTNVKNTWLEALNGEDRATMYQTTNDYNSMRDKMTDLSPKFKNAEKVRKRIEEARNNGETIKMDGKTYENIAGITKENFGGESKGKDARGYEKYENNDKIAYFDDKGDVVSIGTIKKDDNGNTIVTSETYNYKQLIEQKKREENEEYVKQIKENSGTRKAFAESAAVLEKQINKIINTGGKQAQNDLEKAVKEKSGLSSISEYMNVLKDTKHDLSVTDFETLRELDKQIKTINRNTATTDFVANMNKSSEKKKDE